MPVPPTAVGTVIFDEDVSIDRSQLRLFAKATGISTATNVDVTAARAAGYRDLLVPPTFLVGLPLMQPDPFRWLADLGIDLRTVLHGTQSFTYHAPACAGDPLHVRSVITAIEEKKGGLLELIDAESEVTNAAGPVATLRQTIIVRHGERAA